MNQRLEFIDIIKGTAILLVVIGHFLERNISINPNHVMAHNFIYAFHMPLFMFIGGYVAQFQYKHSSFSAGGGYVAKKIRELMLPYLLWPAFFACFFEGNVLFSDFTLPSIIHRLFEAVTNHNELWFLIVFWSLSIIGYIVTASGNAIQSKRTKIISEVLLLFMLLAFAAALHKLFPAYLLWKQIITYGPFFFLGVYIHRYESLQKIVSTKLAYTVGWLLLFTAASQFKGDNPVYRLLGGIGAIPAFLYAARNIVLPDPYKKWLMTFGQYSLAIYIVHYFFLTISSDIRFLAFFTELTQWWLTFTAIFFSIIIACCCVLFAKFIATIPLLNLLLFGKNK